MAEVQSQSVSLPQTAHGGGHSEKDALVAKLDELLEKYLHTLDEYQKAREQLSKQLSSGYLSLAQANFHNRSTTHYGQDSYDERMQATRRVNIRGDEEGSGTERILFSITSQEDVVASSKETNSDQTEEKEGLDSNVNDAKSSTGQSAAKARDPLRWFGILVPPALRSAQLTFIAAIEGPIPDLVTIARNLRHQEIEIGRVRKQIKKT
ncbi:hypothetical protein FB567DRAFT_596197 [Paraphoma chrysanthemicola]|uniref:Vacuolar ATPase assembly protein VMA22 n=1 Tax=Paraphoma chrysanthemicola TaxID=798071 RepID=A0A8K0QZQ2_9PLEO|nr:hypothetical protein FB567DRAFT_596197 [Paraphoma chrysanthemicola]